MKAKTSPEGVDALKQITAIVSDAVNNYMTTLQAITPVKDYLQIATSIKERFGDDPSATAQAMIKHIFDPELMMSSVKSLEEISSAAVKRMQADQSTALSTLKDTSDSYFKSITEAKTPEAWKSVQVESMVAFYKDFKDITEEQMNTVNAIYVGSKSWMESTVASYCAK
ncbi:hypothetical protein WH50_20600 [Pokkaliibacter plantistimulans]|uniref:Phasin domain-containing protein n=1 Tax=Pokkaliibacter plantistimulans TaxID=1635171 RepID=A0ABX5LSX8_9GAMM|nr:hypothetical protein [Pokkaliibacter plantistimulans]PXF29446.1 hypothetical protein WH50_20600 [Pokkaliibacter plantistimulans]